MNQRANLTNHNYYQIEWNRAFSITKNEELVKFIFKESDKTKYSKSQTNFLEQILNSDSSFILDINKYSDLFMWKNGIWNDGVWKNGIWKNGIWKNGYWGMGTWYNGIWKKGYWKDGTWKKGTWKKGYWANGIWEDGVWEDGSWEYGTWENGIWKNGNWLKGTWKNGKWIKGKIWNKNTKKFQESKLPPNKVEWSLSYGNKRRIN